MQVPPLPVLVAQASFLPDMEEECALFLPHQVFHTPKVHLLMHAMPSLAENNVK